MKRFTLSVLCIMAVCSLAYAARIVVPIQSIGANGAALNAISWTTADANSDHYLDNSSGRVLLLCKHGVGTTETVTIVSRADPYGRTGDTSMTCAANGNSIAGPFPAALFNASGAILNFNIADGTSLYFAAVKYTPSK